MEFHQGTRVITLKGYEWLREDFEDEKAKTKRLRKSNSLAPIAENLGMTIAQMAIAWCLKNPNVSTVITGASKPQQVFENMKALDYRGKTNSRCDGAD